MKSSIQTLATVTISSAALLFASGCSQEQKAETKDALADVRAETKDAWADMKEASKETWGNIADATYNERDAFTDGIKSMNDSIQGSIDNIADSSGDWSGSAKEGWEHGIEDLAKARAELAHELDELGDATEDNWGDAKAKVIRAWNNVKAALADLKDHA